MPNRYVLFARPLWICKVSHNLLPANQYHIYLHLTVSCLWTPEIESLKSRLNLLSPLNMMMRYDYTLPIIHIIPLRNPIHPPLQVAWFMGRHLLCFQISKQLPSSVPLLAPTTTTMMTTLGHWMLFSNTDGTPSQEVPATPQLQRTLR